MNHEKHILSLGKIVQFQEALFGEIIQKYKETDKEMSNEELQVLTLFRKITEHTDAIFVLMDHNLEKSAESIARNLFESLLFLKYITLDKIYSKTRALAYHYKHLLNEKDLAITVLNNRNAALVQNLMPGIDKEYVKEQKENVIFNMKRKELKNIECEWKIQQKKQDRRYIEWYSLYQGPKNLKELSKTCDLEAEYVFLYKMFSYQVHSQNAFYQIERVGELAGFKNIRIRENAATVIYFTRLLVFYAVTEINNFFDLQKNIPIIYTKIINS